MKSFSNTYIFIFSAAMVIIVATLLSVINLQLKPIQTKNIEVEKMQSILSSVGVTSTKKNADEQFKKYITESYVINLNGEKVEGLDAFDVDLKEQQAYIEKMKNLKGLLTERRISPFKSFINKHFSVKEIDKKKIQESIQKENKRRLLPVYIYKQEKQVNYIFPVRGKGLWGPIWGYISLESDMNTIYGAVFDHKTETPGLGAEIKEQWFENKFKGKKLFTSDGNFSSIKIVKPGTTRPSSYNVDAISGGTITCKGLEAMMYDCLEGYAEFINNKKSNI